jgi:hypothetical protein
MKHTITFALLLATAPLIGVACSAPDSESGGEAVTSPALGSAREVKAQVDDQAAFRAGIAAQGEAFAREVPPELERELEADYQASLRRLDEEKALRAELDPHQGAAVNFEALFEQIKNTMPPARGALLTQYAAAAQQLSDPSERAALLDRLASPELNNVRRAQ